MKQLMLGLIAILLITSCGSKNTIPVQGTDDPIELSIISIGTHQYLYGNVHGKVGQVLCHYEDCDNPIHQQTTLAKDTVTAQLLLLNHQYYQR